MRSALIDSSYAAARRHLERARVAQRLAILNGLNVYKAGAAGRRARALAADHDRTRTRQLELALGIRARIHQLRIELAAIELANTEPPQVAPCGA